MAHTWIRTGFESYPADFGDGADGDLEVTGTTTLTTDQRYGNLLVSSSGELKTAGFTVSVRGMLDILAGGVISCDGLPGVTGATGSTANGGAGGVGGVSGNASAGNGGGGGGGCVIVLYRETKGSGVGTLSAAGGAAGSGGFGGDDGVDGTTASFAI